MNTSDTQETCSICFSEYRGMGHNAYPINDGRCCSRCNNDIVVPTRIRASFGHDIQPIINAVLEAKLDAFVGA